MIASFLITAAGIIGAWIIAGCAAAWLASRIFKAISDIINPPGPDAHA